MSDKQVGRQLGDLIQMDDGQREFLRVHNKFVYNPEMEAILLTDPPSDKKNLRFGPDIPGVLSHTEAQHLVQAQQREFVCRNPDCDAHGHNRCVEYVLVTHDTPLHKPKKGEREPGWQKWGRGKRITQHIAAKCRFCKRIIKFVPFTAANRRAAGDMSISGPHQYRQRRD